MLTVTPQITSLPADAVLVKRILCPPEFSPSSTRVLQYAGRGAVDSLLFGSTTEQVLREGSCPVLALRAESGTSSPV